MRNLITYYIFLSTDIYNHLLANTFYLHYVKQTINGIDFSPMKRPQQDARYSGKANKVE